MKQQVLTIALSDNETNDLIKLSQILSMVGYFVCLSSPTSSEMINGLRTMSDPPYLCIITVEDNQTDIGEICCSIRKINEDIKIIIQSTKPLHAQITGESASTPNMFCRKDISFPKALLESIRELFKDQIVIVGVQDDGLEFVKLVE